MILFSAERPATLEDVSWIRRALRRSLGEIRLLPEIIEDVQLIVAEMAANVVRHSRSPATRLTVELALAGPTLRLEITDDAASFIDFKETLERLENHPVDQDACSGRGLLLVNDVADRIEYHPGDTNRFIAWRGLANRKPRILIVEDDITLSDTFAAFLEKDFQISQADGVEQALQIAQDTSIDLIVSDYHLSDGHGAAIAETLENDPARLPAPVLMITGDPDPVLHERMLALGVEAMLCKPVAPATLVQQVKLALQRSIRRRTSLFRHFGVAASRLHSTEIPSPLRGLRIEKRTKAADLCSGDAMIHCPGVDRDRVLLMDLMGHGLNAHAAAIAYAAIARTVHGGDPDCQPGAFLEKIASVINKDHALGHFLGTMIVIDILGNGRIEIASAGHPPPAVQTGDGVKMLNVGGALLGFLPNATYETKSIDLGKDDRLLVFTDGVDPAPLSAGAPLPAWLAKAVTAGRGMTAGDAIDLIVKKMEDRQGPEHEDDWTIMTFEAEANEKAVP